MISTEHLRYPGFTEPVPANGYRWWYIDAISDDHTQMLTIIGFIGSVFSPYYESARRKAAKYNTTADPQNHCSINVALYGSKDNRWCMTERSHRQLSVDASQFKVGPSAMSYQTLGETHGKLTVDLNEIAAPIPKRIRGTVEVDIKQHSNKYFNLDQKGNHQWWPIAPHCTVKVNLEKPDQQWHGSAYVDTNWGLGPIEDDINYWCWSRYQLPDETIIYYDVFQRQQNQPRQTSPDNAIGISISDKGIVNYAASPALHEISKTKWCMPRHTRSESGPAAVERTMEDTPFYSRSLIRSRINNQSVSGIHESVSLKRFSNPVVQLMLPFRMPRQSF